MVRMLPVCLLVKGPVLFEGTLNQEHRAPLITKGSVLLYEGD